MVVWWWIGLHMLSGLVVNLLFLLGDSQSLSVQSWYELQQLNQSNEGTCCFQDCIHIMIVVDL